MAKKKTSDKSSPSKALVNKTEKVKELLAKQPNGSPKQIAESLTKRGIQVTPGYVSTIKSGLKKKSGSSKGFGFQGQGKSSDNVSLASLKKAKDFVEACGGLKNARQLLEMYAELI